jgi:hypothetical protein
VNAEMTAVCRDVQMVSVWSRRTSRCTSQPRRGKRSAWTAARDTRGQRDGHDVAQHLPSLCSMDGGRSARHPRRCGAIRQCQTDSETVDLGGMCLEEDTIAAVRAGWNGGASSKTAWFIPSESWGNHEWDTMTAVPVGDAFDVAAAPRGPLTLHDVGFASAPAGVC